MARLDDSIKRYRLACAVPKPSDGTSFVRAFGPLSAMVRQDHRLELVSPRMVSEGVWDLSWDWMAGCDALFLQRPNQAMHVDCALRAKMMNQRVWIDWDDDLKALGRSNPEFSTYMRPEGFEAIDRLTAVADIITFSTQYLLEQRCRIEAAIPQRAGAYSGKSCVIPNACQFPFTQHPRRKVISWRGSRHHAENVATVLPQIQGLSASAKWRDWDWHFMGDIPWPVFDCIPRERLKATPTVHMFAYMDNLARVAPWVHIVPLRDTPFNRSKSNLAWLDATASGAVTLAPDWDEWRRPGIVNYSTPADFAAKLEQILGEYGLPNCAPHPNVALSRRYIEEHLMPGQLNARRWDVLNRLWTQPPAT